jgi:primosomal protein N' (replication factor Y)
MQCPNCDAWLVDHRFKRRLVCHHCGFNTAPPVECPQCHAVESFAPVGPGVERLEQEAAELFPDKRILVLSSDLVESMERLRQELDDVAEGRFDIVIGTQLVAKGHHFPKLNLVGIVDADLGLGNGDPRAAERTFQLLHQVVGRAGREEGRGVGFLQTHQTEHPVMKALILGDREAFYSSEIALREATAYPPFGRLASLVITANERPAAESYGRSLVSTAPKDDSVRVLGPAEAPVAVVRGRHRFRVLVKAPRDFNLSGYLREWMAAAPKPRGNVKLQVDVDPQSFF